MRSKHVKAAAGAAGLLLVGGVAYDLLKPPPKPPQLTAEQRMKQIWERAGGNIQNLSPADAAEVQRLTQASRGKLGWPVAVPDPAKEAKLKAIWTRRGKRWQNLKPDERAELGEYMMKVRAIPGIKQTGS